MKQFLVFFIFLSSCLGTLAQESPQARKNLVAIEGGGAFAAGLGLVYERYVSFSSTTHISARGGAGIIAHFSQPSFYAGASFLYGKKFKGELGINFISHIDRSNFQSPDQEEEQVVSGLQPLAGVRYKSRSGVFFRIFYALPLGPFASPLPYGGLSLGYAF